MKRVERWVKRLVRWAAAAVAAAALLLALGIGAFRLAIDLLPGYQQRIVERVREQTGLILEFDSVYARIGRYGPEIAFRGARLLPASGRVGYVTDELPWSSNEATERYYLTQYAVAPVVVVPEPNQEWVIGNFHDVRSASAPRDMHVARDFGGGLILFRKNGPWPH